MPGCDDLKSERSQFSNPISSIVPPIQRFPISIGQSNLYTSTSGSPEVDCYRVSQIVPYSNDDLTGRPEEENNIDLAPVNAAGFERPSHFIPCSEPKNIVARSRSQPDLLGVGPRDTFRLSSSLPDSNILPSSSGFDGIISERSTPTDQQGNDGLSATSSFHHPHAVVKPTFRTLRIIIRGALQELEVAKNLVYVEDPELKSPNVSDEPAKANMRALDAAMTEIQLVEDWARPLFQMFGLSDEDVAAEFGWKTGESGKLFSIEELQKRYSAAKTEYEGAKQGLLATLSEVKVRKRFLGPPIRKVAGEVKNYTSRELAFYHGQQLS